MNVCHVLWPRIVGMLFLPRFVLMLVPIPVSVREERRLHLEELGGR